MQKSEAPEATQTPQPTTGPRTSEVPRTSPAPQASQTTPSPLPSGPRPERPGPGPRPLITTGPRPAPGAAPVARSSRRGQFVILELHQAQRDINIGDPRINLLFDSRNGRSWVLRYERKPGSDELGYVWVEVPRKSPPRPRRGRR